MEQTLNSTQKKLLDGLSGQGINVTVQSLAKYLASNGVIVTPYVGRMRGYIALPGAAYGVTPETMSEVGGDFYKNRVVQGHMNLIPQEDEAELGKLEKRLRRAVEVRSITDVFLPVQAYNSLKDEFENIREQYFACRDEILAKWETLVAEFISGAREMLEGIDLPDELRAKLMGDFIAEIPKKDAYRNSFKMSLNVKAFPATNEVEGLENSIAADVSETWQNDVVTTALVAIESQIGEGWSRLTKAISGYVKNGRVAPLAINGIAKFADELKWKNVFSNPILKRLCVELSTIKSLTDEQAAEVIESSILDLYAYAKETGIHLDFKSSPYSAGDLDAMLKVAC